MRSMRLVGCRWFWRARLLLFQRAFKSNAINQSSRSGPTFALACGQALSFLAPLAFSLQCSSGPQLQQNGRGPKSISKACIGGAWRRVRGEAGRKAASQWLCSRTLATFAKRYTPPKGPNGRRPLIYGPARSYLWRPSGRLQLRNGSRWSSRKE